jgi:LacI family transcriptional regulator
MATIKDVAARAGVSYTTVSHVLNETRPVRASTRERVLAAARDLRYVPSQVARSLKQQVTATIGLVVPNSYNPYFAELARGVEDGCFRAGRSAVVCSTDALPERQVSALAFLHQRRVDGIIVASPVQDPALLLALQQASCPLVIADRELAGIASDLVQVDNELGGLLAAQHLVALGHRRLGCITGPSGVDVSQGRLHGFRRGLGEAGLSLPDEAIRAGDFTTPSAHRLARELLGARLGLTGLFVQNDLMAVAALRAAGELGLRVPEELSVVGFDDIELARYLFPALTTVGAPIRELGEVAAATMLARIEHRDAPRRWVKVRPVLHARESSGPAPA